MAEFGENVRRLREARGLTQQSLAERLYVTRQAVSRWEGGSRYPDLMTAKQLAAALGSSVDALLTDEDMKQYVEKTPVLESPAARNTQTAVLAFGLAAYIAMSSWFFLGLGGLLEPGATSTAWIEFLRRLAMAVMFGYGTLMSIRGRLTPRVAVVMTAVHFGTKAVNQILYMALPGGGKALVLIGLALVDAAGGVVCIWYLLAGGRRRPFAVYGICVVFGALRAAQTVTNMTGALDTQYGAVVYINSVIALLAELATLGLLSVMAQTLYCKRLRAVLKD